MKRLHQTRVLNPAHTSNPRPKKRHTETYDIKGDGYLQRFINRLPSSDDTARPLYPGEKHMVLKLKNGKSGMANYMGPGTHVIDRVKRGDPGRTPADMVAKRHDIDFTLAQEAPNKKAQIKLAREADKRMVSSLRKIQKGAHGGDSFRNIQAGLRGIEGKMALENRGLLNPSRFAGDLVKHKPADSALLKKERTKLTQEGYGVGLPGAGLKRQVMKKIKRDRMKKKVVSQIVKMSGRGLTLPGGQLLPTGDILKFVVKDMLPNLLKQSGLSKIPIKTVAPIIGKVLKMSKGKDLKGLSQNLTHAILPLMTLKKLKMAKKSGDGLMDTLAFMKKKLNDKMVSAIMGALKMYIGQLGHKGKGLKLPGQGGMCGSGFFSSIGRAFKKIGKSIVSNPLRLAGAIGTLGLSESFLTPAQLLKETTGLKTSKILDTVAPIVATATGNPELALGSKLSSGVLRTMDL